MRDLRWDRRLELRAGRRPEPPPLRYAPRRPRFRPHRTAASLTELTLPAVKILVVEIFGSALGLFGVIMGIIMAAKATGLNTACSSG